MTKGLEKREKMKPLQAGGWTKKSLHLLEPTGHLLKKRA
jgi:hypothetical protein